MYRLSDLQAVEPETLPAREGLHVEIDEHPDRMGLPRVDVVAKRYDDLVAYVREHWGDDDEQWFADYVVGRIYKCSISYAAYCAAVRSES